MSLSRSPRLLKGAIVAFRPPLPLPDVIAFQINPESLQRTIEANVAEGDTRGDSFRLAGAPHESIRIEATLDATDDLERGEAGDTGLHPRLAQLETLLYPPAATVIANTALLALGTIEILPADGPFTLFIWGRSRILPVRIKGMTITEEAYDPMLNPIRAQVSLELDVLSYSDLAIHHPGHMMFLSHQLVKEAMAMVGRANSLAAVLGSDTRLL